RESHFKEGVKEFFRLKASRVKLSSRSADCACTVMEDCIKTDPEINDKLLVTDSLVLPAESVDESIRIIYILQWKHANTIYNNKLQIVNNKVVITRSDLMFNGVEYDENESPVKLGLQKFKGSAKSLSLISTIKLHFITSGELTDYYARLRSAMPGKTEKELFERFCQELYIFYGKPDVCKLKSIVHYTD
ncbi:MAG TPA: hypothetical protein PLA68_08430, partial [Panacibacter sp.]|nr:hypothetical protein [Panacibacter sp.]